MKIIQVICQILRVESVQQKTASCQDVALVRIRTDNGLEGIGEADASPEVIKAIIDAPFSHNIACGLREILVGENPLETERLWQKMYRRTMYFGRSSVTICAMSAIDMAVWDLKGKFFHQPSIGCSEANNMTVSRRTRRFSSAVTASKLPKSAAAGSRQATRPSSSAGN